MKRWARWLFENVARSEDRRTVIGDAEELYAEIRKESGPLRAALWYWGQTLAALFLFLYSSTFWRVVMLKNTFRSVWRNMKKSKLFSIVNIAGLAAGMACAILIFLWIGDELSYDRFHANADRIFRVVTEDRGIGAFDLFAVTPRALGPTLKEDVPEIVRASRFSGTGISFTDNGTAVNERGAFVDADFLRMFSFPILSGDPDTALDDPQSIVLSESMARKYFRGENPIGRTIKTMRGTAFRVTGVMRDVPPQSHLQFDFLSLFRRIEARLPENNRWDDVSYFTYVELGNRAALNGLEAKITASARAHKSDADKTEYRLQPLKRIHLHSAYKFDFPGHGNFAQVMIFGGVALLILAIACLNFMSLSTARSAARTKEIGVRKASGAGRADLVRQFIGESVVMTSLAFVLALGAVKLVLPLFSAFAGKTLELTFGSGLQVWLGLLGLVVFVGLASGLYPALFLSAFSAVSAIKGGRQTGSRKGGFRKGMVVFQFAVSIFLLIGTLTVSRQVQYLRNRPLGYDPDHLLIIRLAGGAARDAQAVKTEFLRNPAVLGACLLDEVPIYEGSGGNEATWEGKPENLKVQMRIGFVDADFEETFRIQLAAGRFFKTSAPTDSSKGVQDIVLNESAVRAMGLENPVGKRFSFWNYQQGIIIGVIKDFQLRSAQYPIEPLVLINDPARFGTMCLRVRSERVSDTIKSLDAVWKKFGPGYPFQYSFYDQAIDELYRAERRLGTLYRAMTVMAIAIACLGLFGLASYLAERRTKEIAVRKVLGASVPGIFILISKEFLLCVAVANLLAWPAAYFFLRSWLRNFAYHTPLGFDLFVLSAGLSLAVSLFTVGAQAFRAASLNPMRSLRYE